ncbi:putative PAS/PAC sensor protein [Methanoregula boonei 6A8]|jgi:PAS domain S-box-containing protein|uniref:Putative PAS/PAC sensor protein n=1 Tax=Methanoregula boonei (strain DSM 21154 / JCM 14090 / 6A8) TaxID=456442 RepID=A7I9W9_METB6|nr:PAS domain S-box protein [Methanoregula boonei]ABS56530.1 putative PAS/PAC sensor protein [Methanoregula boonei 6A8]
MKTHDAELRVIKDLLRNNPKGMKITRIARDLAMNRNTAAKFLEILLMTGQVEVVEHGKSKIFIISRRTSIPTMLDRSADFILVLDQDMKISEVNDNYLKFVGRARGDLLGKRPGTTGLPVIGRQPVVEKIREAHYGADIRTELHEVLPTGEFYFDLRITPTTFNTGKRGITIIIGDITREKKSAISVRESEANFRTLFGESPVGTAVFDSAGELVNANPAFLRLAGVKTRDEIGSPNLFSLEGIPPGSRDLLNTGKKVRFESDTGFDGVKDTGAAPGIGPEGMVFDVRITPVKLTLGEQQAGYLLQIHESQAGFRRIIDHAPDLIARFSRDLKYLYANREIEVVTGITAGEVIGRTNRDLGIPPETALLWDETIQKVVTTGKPVSFEFPLPHCDELRWYRTSCAPERSGSGDVVSVITVTRDITGQKERESDAAQNRKLVEEVLSCIDDAVILVDSRTSTISFVNPAVTKMFGHSREELMGKDPVLLFGAGGSIPGYPANLTEISGNSEFCEIESRMKRKDGEKFPVSLLLRSICDDAGQTKNIVLVVRDTTGRKWAGEGNLQCTPWNPNASQYSRIFPADPFRHGQAT